MNIAELIATAQPRTEKVQVCARGDLVEAHGQAVRAYQAALAADDSLAGTPGTLDAAAAVKAIEDQMDAATVEVTVRAVSRKEWADLLAAHPPSKEQRRLGMAFDAEPFSVALVGVCVDELDQEKAEALAVTIPHGEFDKLVTAAFRLNATGTPRPKLSAATEHLRVNGQSSTTSGPEDSPDPGSLAGSGEQ